MGSFAARMNNKLSICTLLPPSFRKRILSIFRHCSKKRRRVGSFTNLHSIEVLGLKRPTRERAFFFGGGVLVDSAGSVLVGLSGGGVFDADMTVLGGGVGVVDALRLRGTEVEG